MTIQRIYVEEAVAPSGGVLATKNDTPFGAWQSNKDNEGFAWIYLLPPNWKQPEDE